MKKESTDCLLKIHFILSNFFIKIKFFYNQFITCIKDLIDILYDINKLTLIISETSAARIISQAFILIF